MKTHHLIFLAVTVLIFSSLPKVNIAQIFTGGDISVSYSNALYADVAPTIGYKYKKIRIGISPIVSFTLSDNKLNNLSYGARLYSEYDIIKGILAHAEIQTINTNNTWVLSAPLGVGYEYKIAKNVYFKGLVLWDVIDDPNSTQENPIIRAGLVYSL